MRKYNFNGMNRDELYNAMKNMVLSMNTKAVCIDDEYEYIITRNGNDDYSLDVSMDGEEITEESLKHSPLTTVLKVQAFSWVNGEWTVD